MPFVVHKHAKGAVQSVEVMCVAPREALGDVLVEGLIDLWEEAPPHSCC